LADIAQIGFRADTSDLADAKVKLEALTPAAGRAEKASEKLAAAMNGTGSAADKAAAGIQGAGSAAFRMAEGYDLLTGKMNKNFLAINNNVSNMTRMAAGVDKVGTSMKFTAREGLGFTRQFADIGVTAAMGMNPLLIAVQQLPQLFDIIQEKAITSGTTIGAVFRAAGAAIWTALAPLLPIILGIAAAVGVIASAFALGAREINKQNGKVIDGLGLTEKQLERVKKSGVDTAVTIGDTFGAFFSVIGSRLKDAFDGPLKWLADAWSATLDFITKYGARNLELIVGGFIGAVYAIKAVWGTLPRAMGDIMIMAANGVIATVEFLINKTTYALNGLLMMANKAAEMMGLPGLGLIGDVSLGRLSNQFAGGAQEAGSAIATGFAKGLNESKGMMGRFWSDVEKEALNRRRKVIQAAAGKAEKGPEGSKPKEEKDTYERAKYASNILQASGHALAGATEKITKATADRLQAFRDIISGSDETITQLELERDAFGQTAQQADRARIMYDLLAQARQANIALTPAELAALGQAADKQAALNEEIARTHEALEFAKGATRGFFGDLFIGARQGQSIFKTFGDSILNVLDRVLNKMLDFATDAAFGGGNQSGGFLGSLLGMLGGVFGGKSAALPGSAGGMDMRGFSGALIPHAKGGVIGSPMMFDMAGGKTGVAGEAGEEGVLPLARGPDGSLGVQMYGGGAASAPINNVEVHNHYHLSGAVSSDDVQRMVRNGAEAAAQQTQDAVRRSMPSWLDQYQHEGAIV
jgi:hypothetical protein